jgi:hypothetical protein
VRARRRIGPEKRPSHAGTQPNAGLSMGTRLFRPNPEVGLQLSSQEQQINLCGHVLARDCESVSKAHCEWSVFT